MTCNTLVNACCRYRKGHLDNVKKLSPHHRQIAKLLTEAEQQGILDAHLAKITHHEECEVPQNRIGYPKHDRAYDSELTCCDTTASHWRRLDGSQPEWKVRSVDFDDTDDLLQASLLCSAVCLAVVPDMAAILLLVHKQQRHAQERHAQCPARHCVSWACSDKGTDTNIVMEGIVVGQAQSMQSRLPKIPYYPRCHCDACKLSIAAASANMAMRVKVCLHVWNAAGRWRC